MEIAGLKLAFVIYDLLPLHYPQLVLGQIGAGLSSLDRICRHPGRQRLLHFQPVNKISKS